MEDSDSSSVEKFYLKIGRIYQYWLDKSVIYIRSRWATFLVLLLIFFLRIYLLNGWFIVTYGLGIFLLNNFIGFLSPQIDPELDGPGLPTIGSDEFRPFSRRLPEFQFWYSSTRAVFISLNMTLFDLFNIPVFWPILLIYFLFLFFLTMKRQIKHMIKHRYVPWSWGKTKYGASKGYSKGKL